MPDSDASFEAVARRLESLNDVVVRLDPAIRSQAFALLVRHPTERPAQPAHHGIDPGRDADEHIFAALGGLGDSDIEALAFLVMMQAAKSAQEDLKAIMAQVKAMTAAKGGIRDGQSHHVAQTIDRLQCLTGRVAGDVDASKALVDDLVTSMKSDLDSMSEMGEMESLRAQMAMDRLSKMMSTLSNLLKKMSKSAEQITQNLK